MAHNLGLTRAERAEWRKARLGSTTTYSEVFVRTLNGELVTQLTPTGGQVDVDADADVTRSATLTLYDPGEVLHGLHALRYMIHVREITYVPALGRLVACPTFTGPIWEPPSRSAAVVSVTCQDPSAIGLLGVPPKTYPRRGNAVETMKDILTEKCGEARFRFPESRKRLGEAVTVGWEDELRPLVQCLAIADDLGMQLFWDADGIPTLRVPPEEPDDDASFDGLVTSDLTEETAGELLNRVQVEGSKPRFLGAAVARPAHPLSPQTLARHDAARYYNASESDSKAKSAAAARNRAKRHLNRSLRDLREGKSFTIAPLPNLDPLDVVPVDADQVTCDTFSIPITGGEMPIGYTEPISNVRSVRGPVWHKKRKRKRRKRGGRR